MTSVQIVGLLTFIAFGVMVADMISSPAGTGAVFSGLRKMFQIFTNPLNTNGL